MVEYEIFNLERILRKERVLVSYMSTTLSNRVGLTTNLTINKFLKISIVIGFTTIAN